MIECNKCPLAHVETDELCSHYCKDMEDYVAEIRADAINDCIQIIQKIKDDYNDSEYDKKIPINYGTICGIIINLRRLKENKE